MRSLWQAAPVGLRTRLLSCYPCKLDRLSAGFPSTAYSLTFIRSPATLARLTVHLARSNGSILFGLRPCSTRT